MLPGEFPCLPGEVAGRANIAGEVDQLSGEVGSLARGRPCRNSSLGNSSGAEIRGCNRNSPQRARSLFAVVQRLAILIVRESQLQSKLLQSLLRPPRFLRDSLCPNNCILGGAAQ